MHSNGMRLLKLINDLLDLVRLESGRMEVKREPLEVAEFVKGLASAARQVADDKRLRAGNLRRSARWARCWPTATSWRRSS